MCDIDAHFHQALCQFRAATQVQNTILTSVMNTLIDTCTQNLLSLEPGEFERSFFVFRSTVKVGISVGGSVFILCGVIGLGETAVFDSVGIV